jgi:hypothetical protein
MTKSGYLNGYGNAAQTSSGVRSGFGAGSRNGIESNSGTKFPVVVGPKVVVVSEGVVVQEAAVTLKEVLKVTVVQDR